ncbi:MAG: hypothetical protein NTU61_02620 [Candidatus Altiarchaeota archaeon]|nr:hypothetical protein [Candidatus Altiarchaeota archaeon]
MIGLYSDQNRDPRWHTVSAIYLCTRTGGEVKGGDDASDARFFNIDNLPELAFDHKKVIADALKQDK